MSKRIAAVLLIGLLLSLNALAEEESGYEEEIRPDVVSIIGSNPKDLLELRKAINQISKAKNAPLVEITEAKADTIQINLNTGEEMPVIYARRFNPTSVEFLDVTGAPWPIRDFKGYNGDFLTVEESQGTEGHLLFLSPKLDFGEAVVAVLLDGLPTAINFIVKSDNKQYHRVKKIQVMRLGTKSEVNNVNLQIAEQAGQEIDDNLASASFGIRPIGFKRLETKNDQLTAWTDENEILVYTSLNPILPEPIKVAAGQNPGWRAFSYPITTRLTMSNDIGSIVEVSLERETQLLTNDGVKNVKYIKRKQQKSTESAQGLSPIIDNEEGDK